MPKNALRIDVLSILQLAFLQNYRFAFNYLHLNRVLSLCKEKLIAKKTGLIIELESWSNNLKVPVVLNTLNFET